MSEAVVKESKVFNKSNLKITLILFAICAITSFLLSFVYALTKDTIAEQEAAAAEAARRAVLAEAASFERTEFTDASGSVTEAYKGLDDSGGVIGYVFRTETQGFGGKVALMVGVRDAAVTKIAVVDISAETPGVGSKAGEEGYLAKYAGARAGQTGSVDNVTGATYSAKAIKAACEAALGTEVAD